MARHQFTVQAATQPIYPNHQRQSAPAGNVHAAGSPFSDSAEYPQSFSFSSFSDSDDDSGDDDIEESTTRSFPRVAIRKPIPPPKDRQRRHHHHHHQHNHSQQHAHHSMPHFHSQTSSNSYTHLGSSSGGRGSAPSNVVSNDRRTRSSFRPVTKQYRSSLAVISQGKAAETANAPPVDVNLEDGWRPAWLRRRVAIAFAIVFALLAVAAELVYKFAPGPAEMSVEGVWQFGPVIVISILLVFWSRVEFQAKRFAPWITMAPNRQQQPASKTILLDYTSLEYPTRLWTSLRNRDMLVFCSMLASLLLRAQIFLSTGIFTFNIEPTADGGTKLLRVTSGNIHTVAALFGILTLLCLPMVYHAPSAKSGIAPRDPTTIAGTAALLSNSEQLLARLAGTGTWSHVRVEEKLRAFGGSWGGAVVHRAGMEPELAYEVRHTPSEATQSHAQDGASTDSQEDSSAMYQPIKIRPISFIAVIVFSFLSIIGLWLLYELKGQSHNSNGNFLLNNPNDYFLWTSLVTFIFVLLSTSLDAIDFGLRRLTPYLKLASHDFPYEQGIGLDYTNEFGIVTVFKAMKHSDLSIAAAKIMAVSGWLMPIFTAGLFVTSGMEYGQSVKLQVDSFFQDGSYAGTMSPNSALVNDLFTHNTPQYPAWTYQDLAFPSLTVETSKDNQPTPDQQITAVVPATRAILNCTTASFSRGNGLDLKCDPFDSTFHGMSECSGSSGNSIGFAAQSCSGLPSNGSAFNYVWGSCGSNGTVSAIMCEESVVETQMQTMFSAVNMSISTGYPPFLASETDAATGISFNVSGAYDLVQGLGASVSGASLDSFFKVLVQSSQGVPSSMLPVQVRASTVQDAIVLQHGIIRAQVLTSKTIRQSYSSSSKRSAPQQPPPLPASYANLKLLILQSSPQTYALTILLALAIISSLVVLILPLRRAALLPKNPGSIAAQASLLADSTLWWHLPVGIEWWDDDEKVAHRLRRKTFRMGWFDGASVSRDTQGRNYAIGVVQDEGRLDLVELDGGGMVAKG